MSATEIDAAIGQKLQKKAGLFATHVFTGKIVDEGFDVFAFRKFSFFSVRISARYITGSVNQDLKITYSTGFSPWFVLVPIWLFFIMTTRANSYTINGNNVGKLSGIAFSFGIIFLLTAIIVASVLYALRKERLILENELKLTEIH